MSEHSVHEELDAAFTVARMEAAANRDAAWREAVEAVRGEISVLNDGDGYGKGWQDAIASLLAKMGAR